MIEVCETTEGPITAGEVRRIMAAKGKPNDRPVEGHPPGSLTLRSIAGQLIGGGRARMTLTWEPVK